MPLRSPLLSWGSSCSIKEGDLFTVIDHFHRNPQWALLISACWTSSISETFVRSCCSFSTALSASYQGTLTRFLSPLALMSGCPRCTSGRKRRDRTAGSARLVFPTEQKHVLAAGVEERADQGVSKLRNVWSLLLKNIRQPSIE